MLVVDDDHVLQVLKMNGRIVRQNFSSFCDSRDHSERFCFIVTPLYESYVADLKEKQSHNIRSTELMIARANDVLGKSIRFDLPWYDCEHVVTLLKYNFGFCI